MGILQKWKTPSDTDGMTTLTVEDSGSKSNASSVIDALALFSPTSVSVSGADEAIKVDLIMVTTIYARKDKYLLISSAFASTKADVITLLEAQISKLPGDSGGAPGFVLFSAIAAISVVAIILKKRKV
ncbi:hypothetical protein CEE45_05885 [Candidatus Heimdallarchaeota archaeon B3_Heim]|nr:MAG: hypothetical protein CEE45_05885 [Candidatus Heimdallarchaeota archaeon B3_Heim]